MDKLPDVLIIGGGVIGLTTAYELAKQGVAVEVLDRGEFGAEASWAGAGIIPPGNFPKATTPIDQLRAFGATMFPTFSQELQQSTGVDNGYRCCGGIEFGLEEETLPSRWENEGISFEKVTSDQVRVLEPSLTQPPGFGYYFPTMAQLRNPWHLRALLAACEERGVSLQRYCAVQAIEVDEKRKVRGVRIGNGPLRYAERYLIAGGAWSEQLLKPLGFQIGIHPVRGQIALLRTPTPIIRKIVLFGKKYLVPREDGRLLVGATEEPEAGFARETTVSGIEGLLVFAHSLIPALRSADFERSWAGLRPGSADGYPYLGSVPGFTNLFIAAGHYRAGIQLSLGTARVMTELLTGMPTTIPLDFFRLDRIPQTSISPAFRS